MTLIELLAGTLSKGFVEGLTGLYTIYVSTIKAAPWLIPVLVISVLITKGKHHKSKRTFLILQEMGKVLIKTNQLMRGM